MALTSVAGFLTLLEDDDPEIQTMGLKHINDHVDDFWAEISDSVSKIETMAEDETFEAKELASLVVSKVYYHLGEFDEAMNFAFGAGSYFQLFEKSEYTQTLVSKCIDSYISHRVKKSEVDPRLETIVESIFGKCLSNGGYKQAIGIALEARRFDKIEEAIFSSPEPARLLQYCQEICMTLVHSRDFRQQVFAVLVEFYNRLETPDYIAICRLLIFLNDSQKIATILEKLMRGSSDDALLAYQIAFDLVTNATQEFLLNLHEQLPPLSIDATSKDGDDDAVDGPTSMKDDESPSTPSSSSPSSADNFASRNTKIHSIISGETTITLYLDFLSKNNKADLGILKTTKSILEPRNSVTHSATIFANAIMNAGTTRDSFLRENLEWLSRATNWAKFSAASGLGVIHKGHLNEGLRILNPYLPSSGNAAAASSHSEGGALYALGIIHANHGEKITGYLMEALKSPSEIVQHGASLGLGLAGMASGKNDILDRLKEVVAIDSAVSGEAAGIGIGLIMLGTGSESVYSDMLAYAHETQHEKIIRGLSLGISLIMYGREEEAEKLIDLLTLDKDPIIRYGGMLTIAMAYCSTSNNNAIRRLLHFAVSDVSDDVRRAAVFGLGFVLSRDPDQVPRMVQLLAESYNPNVRYGACMAIGIACAGTAMKEAINLLLPMASDSVDFVRQGALIALAMVLIQTTASQEPKVEQVRKMFEERIAEKHEPTMAKFGAILAQGIIDAGGRNVTISLHSPSGHKNMTAIVGLLLFTHYWYWYPLISCISLAFTPTAVVGLDSDLNVPASFSFKSNAKPSLFAYPKEVKVPESKGQSKVTTAVLSTTRKTKRFQEKRARERDGSAPMEVDSKEPKEEEAKPAEEEEKKVVEEPELPFEIKKNPARVTVAQMKYISMDVDERYAPIRNNKGDWFGIVMLKDLKPELSQPAAVAAAEPEKPQDAHPEMDDGTPNPPEPFYFS